MKVRGFSYGFFQVWETHHPEELGLPTHEVRFLPPGGKFAYYMQGGTKKQCRRAAISLQNLLEGWMEEQAKQQDDNE